MVMGTRRDYGSGSIKEIRPGVWRLRWHTGTDTFTGKPVRRTETFTGTKKAANQRLHHLTTSRPTAATAGTVRHLLDLWERDAGVKASTMVRYRYALKHLPDAFLDRRLDTVTSPMIADLYRFLAGQGVPAPSIVKIGTALGSAFRHAVEWGIIDRSPVLGVRKPAAPPKKKVIPTADQLRALIAKNDAQSDSGSAWIRLAINTGARPSEVLHIRWRDVDLDNGAVWIAGTKTEASKRSVLLDPETVTFLRGWRVKMIERAMAVGVPLSDDAYVISREPDSMTPWSVDSAEQRLERQAKSLGFPGVTPHGLRHAHATLLLEHGMTPRTVADRLGHSRVSTTIDIYGHVLNGAGRQAADLFGKLMAGEGKKQRRRN